MLAFFVGKLGLKFFPGWVADAHLREVLKEIHIAPDTFDKHHIRYLAEGCVAMARRIGNGRIEPVVLVLPRLPLGWQLLAKSMSRTRRSAILNGCGTMRGGKMAEIALKPL